VTDSPIPAPADPTDRLAARRALAWTSTAIAVATAFLVVFNAQSMRSWASSRKPTEVTAQIIAVTSAWEAETGKFGLSGPRDWMHQAWGQLRAQTWRAAPEPAQRPPA
jgi:hypothetical protein